MLVIASNAIGPHGIPLVGTERYDRIRRMRDCCRHKICLLVQSTAEECYHAGVGKRKERREALEDDECEDWKGGGGNGFVCPISGHTVAQMSVLDSYGTVAVEGRRAPEHESSAGNTC
jgi:hypothetical protein